MRNISSLAFFLILIFGLILVALMALPYDIGLEGKLLTTRNELAAAKLPAADQAVGSASKNWIALPLENATITLASSLKSEMETIPGVTVKSVQEWDAASQSYNIYEGSSNDDFDLQTGGVYLVAIDGSAVDSVWSLVGDVPDPAIFSYQLQETGGSDFNWIMLPLDLGSVILASELAAHIEANASGAITVDAIQSWNPTAQSYQSYSTVPFPMGDFSLDIGMPYRVSVSSVEDGAVIWPQ